MIGCALLACAHPVATPTATEELEVAAQTVECVGEMRQQCLVVRRGDSTEWTWFYDPIEGFTHRPGVAQRILVERTIVERPLADGSRFRYRLIRVLSSTPAVPPAGVDTL